jgi:hypothetical protein
MVVRGVHESLELDIRDWVLVDIEGMDVQGMRVKPPGRILPPKYCTSTPRSFEPSIFNSSHLKVAILNHHLRLNETGLRPLERPKVVAGTLCGPFYKFRRSPQRKHWGASELRFQRKEAEE